MRANTQLAKNTGRGAYPRRQTERPRTPADVYAPVHLVTKETQSPPISPIYIAKTATEWLVGSVALMILTVIVWLWLHDGGITGVHTVGGAFTSAGRITGLIGTYLLLIQILLLARLPFLEWIVGFDRLTRWHRLNGKLCLSLILAHVGLITTGYAMTDRMSIRSEFATFLTRYPGMMRALIGTILLVLVVVTSLVIVRHRLRYEAWFLVHLMAYAGVFLAWFHQVPTGFEFVTNPLAAAFWLALYAATLQFVIIFRVAQPMIRSSWHRLRVSEVVVEAPGVVSIYITGHHLHWFNARAGQFFQWRFLDKDRWRESHPFSLSAAPDGKSLRITVKALGDFSGNLANVKPGTWVVAEGPFGSFTDEVRTRDQVALIAGGVGITPIRALLEEMSGDLVLIYRASREEDLIFRDELEDLACERKFTIHYVVGDHRARENRHFLSKAHLHVMIPDIAHREVYLCGPRAMMHSVKDTVARLGVSPAHVHSDEFAM